MTSRRFLILCTAISLITSAACVDGGSGDGKNTGNDTTVVDNGTQADTAAPTDVTTDAGETPKEDVAVVDTTVVEDAAVTEDTTPAEDVATEEDASVVIFDDGFTVPAGELAACDNENDILILADGQADLTETMKDCALSCLGEEACAKECVIKELGVSNDCAGCFGANIACTMKNCALHCMDPNNDKCAECQEENCNADFNECAGLVIPGT